MDNGIERGQSFLDGLAERGETFTLAASENGASDDAESLQGAIARLSALHPLERETYKTVTRSSG